MGSYTKNVRFDDHLKQCLTHQSTKECLNKYFGTVRRTFYDKERDYNNFLTKAINSFQKN